MKIKYDRKTLLNIYTIPALILTILNFIVIITNSTTMTFIALFLNIAFWISGILLYKKKHFSSVISIITIIISFIISIESVKNFVDPYFIHAIFILYFITCEYSIFYKNKKIKNTLFCNFNRTT